MYICTFSWENQILGKFISLGLFLLQDTAGSTVVKEYLKYLSDSGSDLVQTLTRKGIPQILGLIAQNSSEMAKFAMPAQEIPQIFGTITVLLHADREINHKF